MDFPLKSEPTNPIEENRRPTDKFFIFLFLSFFIPWLAIGVSALLLHNERTENDDVFVELKRNAELIKLRMNAPITRFSAEFALSLVSSIGLMVLCIYLIEKITKTFLFFAMGTYTLFVFYHAFKLVTWMIDGCDFNQIFMQDILKFVLSVILTIIGAASLFKVGINETHNLIKNSCRMILHWPSLIFFSGFSLILQELVVLFSMNAKLAEMLSDHHTALIMFLRIYNMFGCLMTVIFISNFTLMVISDYCITYYWKNDEKLQIQQIILKVLRYHIGTVMFASIIPIPIICAIVLIFKHKPSWERKENYIFYFISQIRLTLSISSYASTFSSIFGTDFVRSVEKTFDTMLRSCLLYLVTIWAIEAFIGSASEAFNVVYQEVERKITTDESKLTFYLVLKGIEYPVICFISLISICTRALLINQIIILNKED